MPTPSGPSQGTGVAVEPCVAGVLAPFGNVERTSGRKVGLMARSREGDASLRQEESADGEQESHPAPEAGRLGG